MASGTCCLEHAHSWAVGDDDYTSILWYRNVVSYIYRMLYMVWYCLARLAWDEVPLIMWHLSGICSKVRYIIPIIISYGGGLVGYVVVAWLACNIYSYSMHTIKLLLSDIHQIRADEWSLQYYTICKYILPIYRSRGYSAWGDDGGMLSYVYTYTHQLTGSTKCISLC